MRSLLRRPTHLPLFWTICLINGVVFVVGTLVLVLSPASVSADPVRSELVVISIGLAVMLLTDALLIRWALAPLQRLINRLEGIEDLAPTRLPEEGSGPVLGIAQGVNALLARLGEERRAGDARALAAQEAERHRIAQELHDEVGQSLTVVLLGRKQGEARDEQRFEDHQHDRLPADVDDFTKMGLYAEGRDRRDQAPAGRGIARVADEFRDRDQAVEDDERREGGHEPGQ